MRKYLSTLHTRSPRHKNNFALLVSGGFTLLLFGAWHVARFAEAPAALGSAREAGAPTELAAAHEVGPLESLSASVGEGWREVRQSFEGFLDNLNTVDVEQGYEEMKTRTLDTYGR
jgi:hypothetical protein